ncbi:hypothetical protein LDG_5334 [Legionella drancourtii LLAP12]|uniref:Uncharacterized protein n=1 Tax=Legionella drancourtii LLAP12 TaxID=658187 RepID=G9EJH1_9GAMM|nr:hypothetical protein LDG_5334 [Legionella drancourtii LLAP12]
MLLLFVLLLLQLTYSDNEMELFTLKPGTLVVASSLLSMAPADSRGK